jgi:hypothetical protein
MHHHRQFPATPGRQSVGLVLLLVLLGFCGCDKQPYSTVKVSGKVTYEDGSLIPADRIHIIFVSQAKPIDPKIHPRAGLADADPKTGKFDSVTSQNYNDGIVAGEHKVLIQAFRGQQLASDLVPAEYGSESTTPLAASSSKSPFEFKIPKPGKR